MVKRNLNKSLLNIKQIKNVDDLKRRTLTIGFYGVAGFLGYKFLLKPAYRKFKMKNEQHNILSDPNKQQAIYMYNAMNPSGISWMMSMDNTNEQMIYAAARRITNWNSVQNTYTNLYNRNLLTDLQKELDNDEYQTFLRILNASKAGNQNHLSSKGLLVASSKDVRLRSTPDSSIKSYSFHSNIYGVAKANSFLGWTTGRQKVDNNGVRYLQVSISFGSTIPLSVFRIASMRLKSRSITFWVGSGAIDLFKTKAEMNQAGIKMWNSVSNLGKK